MDLYNKLMSKLLPSPWVFHAYTIVLAVCVGFHKPICNWSDTDWIVVGMPIIVEFCLCVCFMAIDIIVEIISFLIRKFRK